MRKVAVVGAGCTRFSGAQPKTSTELFSEASLEALEQSGLKNTEIEAMLIGVAFSDYTEGQQIVHSFASENLGLDHVATNTYDGGCASSTAAMRDAYIWIASGLYDAILVGGVEKAASMGTKLATQVYSMYSDRYFEYPTGITFPGVFAMLAHLYASKYNLEISKLKKYMAQVSVKAHKFGVKNNKAHLQRELTVEKVFRSPMVCQPLQVYDCSPFSDGASAVVLVSEDIARRLTDKPVYITGTGQASAGTLSSQQKYLPHLVAREASAEQAYRMAGVTPGDIDVCEVHDSFSISEILAIESLGFCEKGTGGEATVRGDTSLGGKVVVNPSGGLKAKGHPVGATGTAQVYEIFRQLRGLCGDTQVEGAKIGMTDAIGATGSIAAHIILQKGW